MCFGLARQHCVFVSFFFETCLCLLNSDFVLLKKQKKIFLCTALSSIITCNCFVYIIYNCVCKCAYFIYCKGFVITHFLFMIILKTGGRKHEIVY